MDQDLHTTLDEMEELLEEAPHIPLTGRAVVDLDRVFALMDKLRKEIPEGVQQAHRVIRDRDRILTQAREEAETIIKEAQGYAEKLTRESVVTQRAEEEAGRILDEARRQSRDVRLGAREYAGEVLEKLEANLQKALAVVRQGIEELGPVRAFAEEEAHQEGVRR